MTRKREEEVGENMEVDLRQKRCLRTAPKASSVGFDLHQLKNSTAADQNPKSTATPVKRNAVDFQLAEEDSGIALSMKEGKKKEKRKRRERCGSA